MPPRGAHLCQRHPADLARRRLATAGRAAPRRRAAHEVLGEARLVEHADATAHRTALLADGVEPVAAPEGVLVAAGRTARTRAAAPSRSARPSRRPCSSSRSYSGSVLSGRPAGRSSSGKWILYSSSKTSEARCHDVRGRARVAAEAADVELPHVVARLALGDPLGRVPPGPAAEHDPEDREAREHVQPPLPGHRPHQAPAIGRVAVGAVDDGLDAHLAEARDALGGRDQAVLDLLEVRRQQLAVEALGDPVERPGQRVALERPDEQAASLLAGVERVVRVAEDRQLDVPAPRSRASGRSSGSGAGAG